jgi:hypothetical protein
MVDPGFLENLVEKCKDVFGTDNYLEALRFLAGEDENKRKGISSRIYKDIYKSSSELSKLISGYTDGDKKDYLLDSIRSLSSKAAENLAKDLKTIATQRREFFDLMKKIVESYKGTDLFNRKTDVNEALSILMGSSEQSRGVRMNLSLELRNPRSRAYKICTGSKILDPLKHFREFFGENKEIIYSDKKLTEEQEASGMDPSMKPAVILSMSRRKQASYEFWKSFSL